MRFWMRWKQCTDDYRPITFPPNKAVLGWWCSGYASDGYAYICAVISAENEEQAWSFVGQDWPEYKESFCEEQPDNFKPSDRFPIDGWMIERFEGKNKGKGKK